MHVDHAFRNLDTERTGPAVERDLVQEPAALRDGPGWREEVIGALPEMFFEVRGTVLDPGPVAEDDTARRFHVLNVVEGDGVRIEPAGAPSHVHILSYAETLVVPASVGPYTLHQVGPTPVRIVKSLVR